MISICINSNNFYPTFDGQRKLVNAELSQNLKFNLSDRLKIVTLKHDNHLLYRQDFTSIVSFWMGMFMLQCQTIQNAFLVEIDYG